MLLAELDVSVEAAGSLAIFAMRMILAIIEQAINRDALGTRKASRRSYNS